MKQIKLGHQAPKNFRTNRFNSIEIEGDFSYCESHNFVYNAEVEKEKLYNGDACYYTDNRFDDGSYNFFKNTMLFWQRFNAISKKSCIRRTLNCKNIPIGTIVDFKSSYHLVGKKFGLDYKFKIKKENKLDLTYEVSKDGYFRNFNTCEFSNKLTIALRKNGFIVYVNNKNPNFLMGMINTAAKYTGQKPSVDIDEDGEMAIAYGYGLKIGFSSNKNSYMGYSNGCDNILFDKFGWFNKWSQCIEISKSTDIDQIIVRLKEFAADKNAYNDK